MTTTINFTHDYYKLYDNEFTTIRGRSWFDKVKIGEIVRISIHNEWMFSAQIFMKSISQIDLMHIDFLKKDAEYDLLKIDTKDQFLNLINSFYPRNRFAEAKATMKTELTVIHLRKVEHE